MLSSRSSWLIAVLVLGAASSPVFAKRAAPADVPPVKVGDVEYRVRHFPTDRYMGFVEARDPKTDRLLWERQVYVVVKEPGLEGDVQDVFITKLVHDVDALVITNERGSIYRLDLKTLEIKVERGAIREGKGSPHPQ